jgi:hypothetical protein
MSIEDRWHLYSKIETIRSRPLISYVTSTRQNSGGQMANDSIPEFLDQLLTIPSDCKSVDLLLVSNGGDPTVAWRIISLLRERFTHVGVLIPQSAFSAATLLALGADEIVMHPCANLGPVDVQIQVERQRPNSTEKEVFRFGAEDLAGFLNFVRDNVGLSDQEHMKSAFEMFCKEVGAVPIGVATRGSQLSATMSAKLLKMHMKKDAEGPKATTIAETLNSKFFHHGYPVGRKEAKDIELKVIEPSPDLEGAIWAIWKDLEADLECRKPFNPMAEVCKLQEVMQILFAPVQFVNIPANLAPDLLKQVQAQIVQACKIEFIPPVDYAIKRAVIESPRRASAHMVRGKIFASRSADAKISLNTVQISSHWEESQLPKKKGPPNESAESK